MASEKEHISAGTDQGHQPQLVTAGFQPSNVNLGAGTSTIPTSLSHPGAFSQPNQNHRLYPYLPQQNRDYFTHSHSEPSTMPGTTARSTPSIGQPLLPEVHASGSDPTMTPPIGATKPSHRTPYQYLPSNTNLSSSSLRKSSSHDQLKKVGASPPFSPPFLHPLSGRTKSPRSRSPFPVPAQRSKDNRKRGARFTINPSPPSSPVDPEPKQEYPTPKPVASPLTIRGFLTLPTSSKVITILFACCLFLLFRAFLGIGHSAETCGVFAHVVKAPDHKSGISLGSPALASDAMDPNFRVNGDGGPLNQQGGDERTGMWLQRVEEMYGYQYDWKLGQYEISHDEQEDDHYDDEYEHEELLDRV